MKFGVETLVIVSTGNDMLFMIGEKRAQQARNRQKAKALVDAYGDAAESFVHEKVEATAWQIRDQAHWQRVQKHVRALLS